MKKRGLTTICIMLALLQVMLLVGCNNGGGYVESVVIIDEESDVDGNSAIDNTTASEQGDSSVKTSSKSTSSTQNSNAKTWQRVVKEMPASLKGKTVEYFTTYPKNEIPGVEKAISAFEKASGVQVKWTVVGYTSYDTELNARMSAGNIPDVAFTQGLVFSRFQHFQPLSNINFDFSDKAWDQQTMKDFTINGKVYATHLSPEYTYMHQPQAMYYNKDLIKKYDLEDPYKLWKSGKWTFNKMMEMAKIFKDETGNLGFSFFGPYEYPMMKGLCAGPFGFDGKTVTNTFKETNLNSVMQEMATWKQNGLLSTQMLDEGSFVENKMLFYTFNFGTARYTNSHCLKMKQNGTFGIVPLPAIDGQKTYYQIMGEYEGYCIPKGAKNAEIVPYFLRAVFDKSNYNAKKFFCSDEALDVYNWSMKQTRVMQTYLFCGQTQTRNNVEVMSEKIWGASSSAVATEIAKGRDTLDIEIASLNKILKNF